MLTCTNLRNWINAVSIATNFVLVFVLPSKGIVYGRENVSLIQVNPDDWVQECATVFQDTCCRFDPPGKPAYVNYSTYDILTKPSGLCVPNFSCAWSKCIPDTYQSFSDAQTFVSDFMTKIEIDVNTTYEDLESVLGPGLNLPEMIAFPTGPSDIIQAIQHAKQEGMTVSIKTSGHSYTGSSTNAGSVQLNLREYPKYSKTTIVECGNDGDAVDIDHAPACKLATARGKKAFVRVGGGEVFQDTASSVFALKDVKGDAKYLMLHGAGTVGAAGGWLQGGGLGSGQERLWGLGVDQVLEIEMVLADERHIKLYPTEWEDVEGFLYPKTIKVNGLCNINVFADDESMWVWEPCEDPIPPFEDLWFAVRGGGGGTYGVVTSVKLQLHDNIPFFYVDFNSLASYTDAAAHFNLTAAETTDFAAKFAYCSVHFSLDFLFNPESVNVTREDSNHCGNSNLMPINPKFFCLGQEAADAAKKSYDRSMSSCVNRVASEFGYLLPYAVNETATYGPHDSLISFLNIDNGLLIKVPGQLDDDGPSILPETTRTGGWTSAQVPVTWLASKSEDSTNLFLNPDNYDASHTTGGNVAIAHDQMNAVPLPERQSGFASAYGFGNLETDLQERLLATFLNETVSTGKSFPGYNEYNHIASFSYGPLKSDMTKICPVDFTMEEKEEKCFSMQESVWGVELTAKLEGIKYAVDPDHLFYCYACIEPKERTTSTTAIATTNAPESAVKSTQTQIPLAELDFTSASQMNVVRTTTTVLVGGTLMVSLLL